ncbi:hypothetical protein [Streptomyces sp. VRA16 Mangrove soil]|nr:hypothetical protein [Streptomyces sp. VRA16 Mangrove soil]MBO1336172.1 hypothetical protein [Streptomyces sp. VRA16 Mangrove soil]
MPFTLGVLRHLVVRTGRPARVRRIVARTGVDPEAGTAAVRAPSPRQGRP